MGYLKGYWRQVRPAVLSNFLFHLSRAVGNSLRLKAEGFPSNPSNCIFCGWHGKSIIFANFFSGRGCWVIISQSKDGDMQATVFQRLGYNIIRGSTGRRGVAAALEAIRALKDGGNLAITPDGPRGPSGSVQGGVMLMARKSGASIIPVGISARPRKIVNSWDHHLVPFPFSRAILIAGDPILVPADANEEEVERLRLRLKAAIDELEDEAERRMGYSPIRALPAAPDTLA
jgi:lysophospholipid acyltransferase (LPLAT)-like uncharacterized protein